MCLYMFVIIEATKIFVLGQKLAWKTEQALPSVLIIKFEVAYVPRILFTNFFLLLCTLWCDGVVSRPWLALQPTEPFKSDRFVLLLLRLQPADFDVLCLS